MGIGVVIGIGVRGCRYRYWRWVGRGCVGLGLIALAWIGLVGLDCVGLDWVGWVGLR